MLAFHGYQIKVNERKNCRRIILHHRPTDRFFTLSVPVGTSQQIILQYLQANEGWMQKQLSALAPTDGWLPSYAAGEQHFVLGKPVILGKNGVPTGRKAVMQYQYDALYKLVVQLIPMWQQRIGVHADRVQWKTMVSRWGSCHTQKKVVTLNLRLAEKPAECVEYVVVHELCHLIHANHSAAFHAEQAKHLPDWKQRKELLNHFDTRPTKGESL